MGDERTALSERVKELEEQNETLRRQLAVQTRIATSALDDLQNERITSAGLRDNKVME